MHFGKSHLASWHDCFLFLLNFLVALNSAKALQDLKGCWVFWGERAGGENEACIWRLHQFNRRLPWYRRYLCPCLHQPAALRLIGEERGHGDTDVTAGWIAFRLGGIKALTWAPSLHSCCVMFTIWLFTTELHHEQRVQPHHALY